MLNKYGVTIARILLGIIFFAHGVAKIQMGLSNVAGWFNSIGIPSFVAYGVAYLELLGGLALIVGAATRIVSSAFVLMLIGAIFTAKLPAGLLGNGNMAGYELDIALIVIGFYFAVASYVGISIDEVIKKRQVSKESGIGKQF